MLASGTFTQNGQTREAIAANFLANPVGRTATSTGSGIIVNTESVASGAGDTLTSAAFFSRSTLATVNETLGASALGSQGVTLNLAQTFSRRETLTQSTNDQIWKLKA